MCEVLIWGYFVGVGLFIKKCEYFFEVDLGKSCVFFINLCIFVFEMIVLVLGFGLGDEVIILFYIFVSMVNVFYKFGIMLIFCDICVSDLMIDVEKVVVFILLWMKVVVLVYYVGVEVDMSNFKRFCENKGIEIIEDVVYCDVIISVDI